jgi:hypothetical protein
VEALKRKVLEQDDSLREQQEAHRQELEGLEQKRRALSNLRKQSGGEADGLRAKVAELEGTVSAAAGRWAGGRAVGWAVRQAGRAGGPWGWQAGGRAMQQRVGARGLTTGTQQAGCLQLPQGWAARLLSGPAAPLQPAAQRPERRPRRPRPRRRCTR